MMMERRNRDVVLSHRFLKSYLCVIFSCVFLGGFTFSTFRLLFRERFRPALGSTWRAPIMRATGDESPISLGVSLRETVMLPDQVLLFLKYPRPARLFTEEDFQCVYYPANSSRPFELKLKQPPIRIDGRDFDEQILRCRIPPRGFNISLDLNRHRNIINIPVGYVHRWDSVSYEAVFDRDNTTLVFIKGLNLRRDRAYNPSRFECVYGWDFRRIKFLLRSELLSIGQEVGRCETPLSVLSGPHRDDFIKVSIRLKGKGIFRTVAHPVRLSGPEPPAEKDHEMCICTMLRNQARFIREWVMYHARIGVQRWFIYDNNSNDNIESVIDSLSSEKFNITRHVWPWIKTQEAGFAHCALRARDVCNWVGFIDVDEFFRLPSGLILHDLIRNLSGDGSVAELRISCHSFGPSGLKEVPKKGVMVGYTCRLATPERHKSIVKPEALNSTLINVVHHFHLRDGFEYVNVNRSMLVINHYKYQVWEVFKDKFLRRVATYVADWQDTQNVGSKDRVPGLGTRAIEPPDWSGRFCEVNDTTLRDRVLEYADPVTHLLPWQARQQVTNSLVVEE